MTAVENPARLHENGGENKQSDTTSGLKNVAPSHFGKFAIRQGPFPLPASLPRFHNYFMLGEVCASAASLARGLRKLRFGPDRRQACSARSGCGRVTQGPRFEYHTVSHGPLAGSGPFPYKLLPMLPPADGAVPPMSYDSGTPEARRHA